VRFLSGIDHKFFDGNSGGVDALHAGPYNILNPQLGYASLPHKVVLISEDPIARTPGLLAEHDGVEHSEEQRTVGRVQRVEYKGPGL
jgi:hypothetical protein